MPSLRTSRRWSVASSNPQLERELSRGLNIAPLVARVMVSRGIGSVEEGRLFLSPSLERDWADPLIIPGMGEVADRVERAVRSGESIVVFGDFDVDGITSTCLLTEALRELGAEARPFIPRRFDEGYGISHEALERLVQEGAPGLVVTVDNGIAARHEAQYLADRGIDLVVTDHHEPGALVPEHIPLTDPKLDATGPSRELAGAGVALKLVHVLGERLGRPGLWRRYTEVAALGTVSDMMPLTPENRALVADGLARMRTTTRPGYIALAAMTRTDLATVTTEGLSFSLIPRLNAAGRMADPILALQLLMAADPIEAGRLAAELEEINQERRAIEADLTEQAVARVEAMPHRGRALVVAGEGWHEGVKGIVASRLVNRYRIPALLFSIEDGEARGSGRSVGSINLFEALERCSDLLIRFGGHAAAVGVTCAADKLDALQTRLNEVLCEYPAEAFEEVGEVAATVSLSELEIETISELSVLEPFGQGNRAPLFAATGVTMIDRACVGRTGDHVRFVATDGSRRVGAIMFRAPNPSELVACDTAVDVVFQAIAETWQGYTKTKLMVKDILLPDQAPTSDASEPLACLVRRTDALLASENQRICRSELACLDSAELTSALTHALIGANKPHPAQAQALDALQAGKDVLAIMGTGRGKSFIFQVHAAREAILKKHSSIFVYPLRALVADQAVHMRSALSELGLKIAVLTGETEGSRREEIYRDLAQSQVDIVLTTPEFLAIHKDRLARVMSCGFLVIDEAHHIAGAKAGDRSAYLELPCIRKALHDPVVLACTATAPAATFAEITAVLPTLELISDEASRPNLSIEDDRDLASRENRLVSIVAGGEKCVIYVNSRDQSAILASTLRRRVPELAQGIAFYHGGLTRQERALIESAFRSDDLCCIVSTSAFGEGVNLPDIRHVVLYHMPFSSTEFNQLSGRAGRDGKPAGIHLLYSARDARINERLLKDAAPPRPVLVTIYRALLSLWRSRQSAEPAMPVDARALVATCSALDRAFSLDVRAIPGALGIFCELGLIRLHTSHTAQLIEVIEEPERVDLFESIRYLEGLRAKMAFDSFRDWALEAAPRDMLARIIRPITPQA
ncbi:single-stranded-DNA-specific exonuclease RecJ [Collinsella sp. AGMB00827]|uniref:Single-stranded-DNA-specific exonuclease RecJ n=1 Tax=Collinsella ureilytica TaxID=2869515 RepID=A0ABS7ML80_9ACTN|nr:single-stranded-DNA-specific exonuclease RecJ [Collinsella urealyticum]MBY4798129.1 single-stranded-DNA-specific exonuclease RecJ [Collinsella urealyticum]